MSTKNRLKITVLKRMDPSDIFETLPVAKKDWMVPCKLYEDGQEFIIGENLKMPEGFCQSAWESISTDITTIAYGGNFPYFDEKGVSVSCCNDGIRPVIFKIERI